MRWLCQHLRVPCTPTLPAVGTSQSCILTHVCPLRDPFAGLLLLSGGSVIGIVLLKLYLPRLDKPYISRVR
jgi:hypothetical protein